MKNEQWKTFFTACADILGKGSERSQHSNSWCSWTTFERLNVDAGYWTSGLPNADDIDDSRIKDSPSVWGQPFEFAELAHVIVPRFFYWETDGGAGFRTGTKEQNIDLLSKTLSRLGIEHRLTKLVLEIKLF